MTPPENAAQPEPRCPQPPICSACHPSMPCRPECHICRPKASAAHPYEALRPLGKRVIREAENLCEVTPDNAQPRRNDGGCPSDPVAVRVEHGFADLVCHVHAASAERRGAIVVWGTDD